MSLGESRQLKAWARIGENVEIKLCVTFYVWNVLIVFLSYASLIKGILKGVLHSGSWD